MVYETLVAGGIGACMTADGEFELDGALMDGSVFFFNDTATTEIYTLSLHDALPICPDRHGWPRPDARRTQACPWKPGWRPPCARHGRSCPCPSRRRGRTAAGCAAPLRRTRHQGAATWLEGHRPQIGRAHV